jgi:hypothetical protein
MVPSIRVGNFELVMHPGDRYGYQHTTIRQRLDKGRKAITLVENAFDYQILLSYLGKVVTDQHTPWMEHGDTYDKFSDLMRSILHGKKGILSSDWRFEAYKYWGSIISDLEYSYIITERAGPACGLTRPTDPSIGYHAWRIGRHEYEEEYKYVMLPKHLEAELSRWYDSK